jgi:hypothetical protein
MCQPGRGRNAPVCKHALIIEPVRVAARSERSLLTFPRLRNGIDTHAAFQLLARGRIAYQSVEMLRTPGELPVILSRSVRTRYKPIVTGRNVSRAVTCTCTPSTELLGILPLARRKDDRAKSHSFKTLRVQFCRERFAVNPRRAMISNGRGVLRPSVTFVPRSSKSLDKPRPCQNAACLARVAPKANLFHRTTRVAPPAHRHDRSGAPRFNSRL